MMMSTPEEKLSWIFEIFDSDGGNLIISQPMKEAKVLTKVVLGSEEWLYLFSKVTKDFCDKSQKPFVRYKKSVH